MQYDAMIRPHAPHHTTSDTEKCYIHMLICLQMQNKNPTYLCHKQIPHTHIPKIQFPGKVFWVITHSTQDMCVVVVVVVVVVVIVVVVVYYR